jgi:two-component system, chemotaxis family, chemotaxis protein CheY
MHIEPPFCTKTVLVIDDSPVIRRVVMQMLCAARLDAIEASSAVEARARCRKAMPDAIILDWILSDARGIELILELRKLRGGATPVIFLSTTENDPRFIRVALAAGADDILIKPFDRATLQHGLGRMGLLSCPASYARSLTVAATTIEDNYR